MPPKRSGGGAPLTAITERLNYLELRLADITPESSRVILQRMVELEETTRVRPNHVVVAAWKSSRRTTTKSSYVVLK